MNISTILELVAGSVPDRVAVCDDEHRLTYEEIDSLSSRLAEQISSGGYERVSWLASNSVLFPALVFACAKAGVPFVPLNYRLADDMLSKQAIRLGRCLLVVDDAGSDRLTAVDDMTTVHRNDLLDAVRTRPSEESGRESAAPDPAGSTAAIWLFTSGTTGPPKISVLEHSHLSSYILSTVDLCSAGEDESILVSVPPYHIAGLASVLSSFFAARRMVYLDSFDAQNWVDTAAREKITQAMVVPTMMQRILDALPPEPEPLPGLRSLSYGGGRMPREVISAALERLPRVDFANAYGLTETSSTITLLGPDDHRAAVTSDDEAVARRLASVGKPVPGLELQIRTATGGVARPGQRGEIWVRGPQVSGQYLGQPDRAVDDWFRTRDEGELDEEGFLFLHGRVDDVIVRGGENISPGEIEDVLRTHVAVRDVVVVAEPHEQWGEAPVAVIVESASVESEMGAADEDLKALVRARLRSSRIPERIVRVPELPYSELGKIQRNAVKDQLARDAGRDVS